MPTAPVVPEDLGTLSPDDLANLLRDYRAYAVELSEDDSTPLADLEAAQTQLGTISGLVDEARRRADVVAAINAANQDGPETPEPEPESTPDQPEQPEPQPEPTSQEPVAVTAAVDHPDPATQLPAQADQTYVSMVAAHDVPDFSSGATLSSWGDAARAVESRLAAYPGRSAPPAESHGPRYSTNGSKSVFNTNITIKPEQREYLAREFKIKNPTRHGAVRFRRDYPDELRANTTNVYDRALFAANERRLPGGSLMESQRRLVEAGRSLTAAAGWCAISENIYRLCELESLDGILDLPELQADRGGFQVPEDGGPDFTTIWNSIGDAGDVILTEYEIQQGTVKVCTDIPCPNFVDTRLDVAYACLTGSLLQRRGWPEIIARFSSGTMIALAHKVNEAVIEAIVTAAGAATVIPADPGGDDAAAAVLSGVELGIVDMKYRNRMPFAASLEVVLPFWSLAVMRAALARRSGVGMLSVPDSALLAWFNERGATPRFVYDWQDALSGLAGGPGGTTAITEFPATMDFLVYPAGTFTKIVADVISLDTIFDSANLVNNEFIALFAEEGFGVIQTCPDARQYTVPVDVSGCVGCITGGTS